MTCDQIDPLLNALADHELSFLQARRVRRHLAACPACAARFADIQRLDASVRAWHDAPAPAGLGAQITAALPPPMPRPVWHRFPVRPAAVGLGSLAAAIAMFLWLAPGQPGRPTIAYADVERAMQQVQTVSWGETMMFYDRAGHPVNSVTYQATHWLRRDPPALASLGQFQDLRDARGDFIRLAPGYYAFDDLKHFGQGSSIGLEVEHAVREITQPQTGTGYMGNGGNKRDQFKFSSTRQRPIVLNGLHLILFTRNQEIIAARRHGTPDHYFLHIKMWADPITRRVVRIETRDATRDTAGGVWSDGVVTIQSNFHYNQSSPTGVFDWSPPPGAKIYTGRKAWNAMFYFTRHPVALKAAAH